MSGTSDYFDFVADTANFGRALRQPQDPRTISVPLDSPRMREYEEAIEKAIFYNPFVGMHNMAYGVTARERQALFVDLTRGSARPQSERPSEASSHAAHGLQQFGA